MMLTGAHQSEILAAFGVEGTNPNAIYYAKDSDGNIIDEFRILWNWEAAVRYFEPNYKNNVLIIAVMQTTSWLRGFIDVPFLDGRMEKLKAVDLVDWEKPFVTALESACLVPEVESVKDSWAYACEVNFAFSAGFGKLSFCGPVDHEAYSQLWDALFETIKQVSAIYSDKNLNAYIRSEFSGDKHAVNRG